MGRAGLELDSQETPQPLENKDVSSRPHSTPAQEAAHDPVHVGSLSEDALSQMPHDLKQIITGWPDLPEHVRQAIVTLVASVTVTAREGDEVV